MKIWHRGMALAQRDGLGTEETDLVQRRRTWSKGNGSGTEETDLVQTTRVWQRGDGPDTLHILGTEETYLAQTDQAQMRRPEGRISSAPGS